MKTMDYVFADYLNADQLMEGDLIKVDDDIVEIKTIKSDNDYFYLELENSFGESIDLKIDYDAQVEWFVLIED